jgi:hypothetical protein
MVDVSGMWNSSAKRAARQKAKSSLIQSAKYQGIANFSITSAGGGVLVI